MKINVGIKKAVITAELQAAVDELSDDVKTLALAYMVAQFIKERGDRGWSAVAFHADLAISAWEYVGIKFKKGIL